MSSDYSLVLVAFMAVALLITLCGVIGTVLVTRYISRSAERIGRDISAGMARKIEADIKRDIDSGNFFY